MATYLTRTNSSSSNTYTFSAWLKHTTVGVNDYKTICLFGTDRDVSTTMSFAINDSDKWNVYNGSSHTSSDQVARDCNAWYHVVLKVDNLVGTIYVKNEIAKSSITCKATGTETNKMIVGGYVQSGNEDYFNGVMAHVHFTDGTAYSPSDFGETDATTGIWKPKTAPSVTYGTNGFFLKFENSGAFGTDSSGNSNTFTVNGTMTQTIDTPSNVFATLNPLNGVHYAGLGFSNGNNSITTTAGQYAPGLSTLGVSTGKWYGEFKMTSSSNWSMVGVTGQIATATNYSIGHGATGYGYAGGSSASGQQSNNNTFSSYGDTYNNGDIIGIALDLDNNKLYFSKNGTFQNSGDPTSGATGTGAISISASPDTGFYYMGAGNYSGTQTPSWSANFGNGYFGTTAVSSAQNPDDGIGIFEYAVPTGYKALCTKSINAQDYD
jgi:hypothetical protein